LPRVWSSRGVLWAWALFAVVVGVVGWQTWQRQSERDGTLADASVIALTNFGGVSQAAAVSRDGRYAAFLSDRDGRMDLWVTQIGTGVFYNRTRDAAGELVKPAVRTVGFTPDGANVTFWVRGPGGTGEDIGIWAAPVLGGQPRLYLEGVAEYDFSRDGRQLVYHTPGPGDPTFVRDALDPSHARLVFSAPSKRHSRFSTWSPDQVFIYFVQGQATTPWWNRRSSSSSRSAAFVVLLAGFSLDRLVRFLVLLGNDVQIVVKARPRSRRHARLMVA